MFNKPNGTLYVGVTASLAQRVSEHKAKIKGFTAKYNVTKLGYVEEFKDLTSIGDYWLYLLKNAGNRHGNPR